MQASTPITHSAASHGAIRYDESNTPDSPTPHRAGKTSQKAGNRVGAVADNPLHRRLFSLPELRPSAQTLPAVTSAPKKLRVTGDREVDAVLWLREVIGTGDAALIAQAQAAAAKIKTPLKELEERYTEYLRVAHPGNPFATLSSCGFANLNSLATTSIERRARQVEALGRFGSEEAVFADTPAEAFCFAALEELEPQGLLREFDKTEAEARFRRYPAELPHTLGDCLHELAFWDRLASLRYAFNTLGGDSPEEAWARQRFIFGLLAEIPPRDHTEAREVLAYLYASNSLDRSETRAILTNLIG